MALAKTSSASLPGPWQPRSQPGGPPLPLRDFDPTAQPYGSGDKAADKAAVDALASRIDELQDRFFADRRHKLLVVLQGTDGSGKDGAIRGVFGRTSPLGVNTVSWRAPTDEERSRDFLWRIHQRVPAAGEFMVFNRSHYEDVLVPVVNRWITPAQARSRMGHINDFERMLCETGTVVVKFMLHISRKEQGERLQARLDDPAKNWKFQPGDLEVRERWADYQKAYGAMLGATSTPWAPWTVVPADSKTHRNLMIATVLCGVLEGLKLHYPPPDPALRGVKVAE